MRTVGMNIRIHGALRDWYFEGMNNAEVLDVIGRALETWFHSRKAMYV